MPSILRRLFKNQQAATLVEYALIVAPIATVSSMGAIAAGVGFVMASAANGMN